MQFARCLPVGHAFCTTALRWDQRPEKTTLMDATQSNGRILLVDDEPAILRTFRYCLEDEGYLVATASNGMQAESVLHSQVFDLCFLDLRLGEEI